MLACALVSTGTVLLVRAGCPSSEAEACLVWISGSAESSVALLFASAVTVLAPGALLVVGGPGARPNDEWRLVRSATVGRWMSDVVVRVAAAALLVASSSAVAAILASAEQDAAAWVAGALICLTHATHFTSQYLWMTLLRATSGTVWGPLVALVGIWLLWLSSPAGGILRPPWTPEGALMPLLVSAAHACLGAVALALLTHVIRSKGLRHA